jgi:sugar phosphate isomerase/epimerase
MYSYNSFISKSDRYGVFGTNDHNYPFEDIMRAIQEVGFDKGEVEEYIRDRYNRS